MNHRVDVRGLFIRASDVPVRQRGQNSNVFWMKHITELLTKYGVRWSTTGKFLVAFMGGSLDTRTMNWRCQGQKGVGYASLEKFLKEEA